FDTSKVVNMHAMFSDCTALQKLDIGNFVANEWVSVSEMFYNCEKLSIINLSGFNTIGHNNFDMMFGFDKQLDHTIPTLIITSNQRIINDVVTDDVMMAYRTPYYTEAKVIYNSNHEVFDDGNTTIEKTIHQSDRFVYSTMEEVKQEFTFDATTILKDSPKITDKEGFISTWYLDEACTMPFDETGSVDFTTLTNGTLQLYAGYKEVTPEEKPAEPEDTPDTPKEEIKEPESKIEEVKKEQTSAVNTGNEVSKGMYYMLLGGSVIVLGAMAYKCRKSEL
ncbi:MAG TPA: BspA family leucine-rich repeat surface protein, partial [Candidatus Onthosoma merdavium]|nr:BspA family leucine-rich repeat surface protein [Candidatus Onthosoma merdavium]